VNGEDESDLSLAINCFLFILVILFAVIVVPLAVGDRALPAQSVPTPIETPFQEDDGGGIEGQP
jgi:hypothetical protein